MISQTKKCRQSWVFYGHVHITIHVPSLLAHQIFWSFSKTSMDLSLPNFSFTCLVSFLFAPTVVTPQTTAMLLIVLINALEKSWLQSVSSESGQIMTNSVNGGFQGNGMKIFMKFSWKIMKIFWEWDSGETQNCLHFLVAAMLLFFLTMIIARLLIFMRAIHSRGVGAKMTQSSLLLLRFAHFSWVNAPHIATSLWLISTVDFDNFC